MLRHLNNAIQQPQLLLLIFKFNNTEFYPVGELDVYQNAFFSVNMQGGGRFEFFTPILPQTTDILKIGNLIWTGGDYGYVIESLRSSVTSSGALMYHVTGRSLAKLLTQRIIFGTYTATNKRASTIMYELVSRTMLSPTDTKRKIPYLSSTQNLQLGDLITMQQTGGIVYDHIDKLAREQELGYRVKLNPQNKMLLFDVYKGVDRTINQSTVLPIEFASDLDDILESEHYRSISDMKTFAFIAGEGEGGSRTTTTVGNTSLTGLDVKEMYVDARDLQSETSDDNGSTTVLSPSDYLNVLRQRGNEKLSQASATETVEASIRIYGDTLYKYGVDYKIGDTITITDKRIDISMSAAITGAEETFGEEYKLNLLFGFNPMTLLDRIKNAI
jgi:hypothetical protein